MRKIPRDAFQDTTNGIPIPAPIGGWNTRDPITSMPVTDAIVLDNIFPQSSDVMLRKGYTTFCTVTVTESIKSLHAYKATSGTDTIFACTDSAIYKVTQGGVLTAANAEVDQGTPPVALAITSGAFQSTMITTAGGSFLWMCNGVDDEMYYDGTNWTILTTALTGITPGTVANVSLFKSRLFLTELNSLSVWYLPVNSVSGAASEIPLGAIFRHGGYIVATESWTLDAGDGPDDRFCIVTSNGELAVYVGTNPANASTWSLVGVYRVGAPIGRDCFIKVGGDLALLTSSGLLPLSKALLSVTINRKSNLTDKVQKAFNEAYLRAASVAGWQPLLYSEQTMLLINVPVNASVFYQFVMNTLTGAWCRFTGMNGRCWCVANKNLYFASGYTVSQAWDGEADAGSNIVARIRQAYTDFGFRGVRKVVNLVKSIFTTSGNIAFKLAIDADYTSKLSTNSESAATGPAQAVWDTDVWDTAQWAGTFTTSQWRKVSHKPGHVLSLRMEFALKNVSMNLSATNFLVERAGLL